MDGQTDGQRTASDRNGSSEGSGELNILNNVNVFPMRLMGASL